MKKILLRKRNVDNVETVALTEECSALLQNNAPPKLADPSSFSIPCHIGTYLINNALCDLGASVSVLPLSLAKRLGLTKFQCTGMTVQMADHSLSRPLGVLEDVPVKIGRFFIPVDFVVLDIPEDTRTPIILGRPFLHIAGLDRLKDPGSRHGVLNLETGTVRIHDPGGGLDEAMPHKKKVREKSKSGEDVAAKNRCS
ncbi:UBA domain-containing protein Mud1-like [Silene latifolia]|uniref:UBA domain-containing protein Mud1-like n=1 Tax=Silene latifolia TaxID=37657 RepID=UPI003D771307